MRNGLGAPGGWSLAGHTDEVYQPLSTHFLVQSPWLCTVAVALAAGAGSSLQLTLNAAVAGGVAGKRERAPMWPLSLQSDSFLYVPGQD